MKCRRVELEQMDNKIWDAIQEASYVHASWEEFKRSALDAYLQMLEDEVEHFKKIHRKEWDFKP